MLGRRSQATVDVTVLLCAPFRPCLSVGPLENYSFEFYMISRFTQASFE